jgi:DNA-binding FrmR family transcriptional regulator
MDHARHDKQLNRLRRIHGQVGGLIKMVEDGRYCIDILTQTHAVKAALRRVEDGILAEHIQHCVAQALGCADSAERDAKLAEIQEVMRRFVS